jgi:hypothetical protein
MAKAARKNITPRRTAPSSRKSSPIRSHTGDVPMTAPGCPWEMWSGVIGLSTDLKVFDADIGVGNAGQLADSERTALADYMIALWTRFREAKTQNTNYGARPPLATHHGEKINHFGNPEEQICDLMRAADLSAYLIEEVLSDGQRDQKDSGYVYLPDQFKGRLVFVAYEVRNRVEALKEFYYADGFETPKAAG